MLSYWKPRYDSIMFRPPLTYVEVQEAFQDSFTIDESIYSGGQGSVFRARAAKGEDVALKIYFPDQLEERLAREVEALKRIDCPTLVKLHSHGTCKIRGESTPFVATSFIVGQPLSNIVCEGPLSVRAVSVIGRDICTAIDALWNTLTGERIVHRDIKPSNIVLSSESRAVLIDLGVARHVQMSDLTSTGTTWGTVGYMSPEQVRASKQLSCKSDIFAVGVVLQECLAGKHPTGGRQHLLTAGAYPTRIVAPNVPVALADVIDRMLSAQAIRRPQPSDATRSFAAILEGLS